MTTREHDEQDKTAPIELPAQPSIEPTVEPTPPPAEPDESAAQSPHAELIARAASPAQQEVMFVPLAVSVGDGFKFGCGFFLAAVLAALVGFVLLAALFVLSSVFGVNVPLGR